jgi:hypothetical protein
MGQALPAREATARPLSEGADTVRPRAWRPTFFRLETPGDRPRLGLGSAVNISPAGDVDGPSARGKGG